MALGMVVFGIAFIIRDPLNIQEWAMRGSSNGAPTMAAYFGYETLRGASGHLVVLGIVMGGVLGIVGSVIGKGLRAVGILMGYVQKMPPAWQRREVDPPSCRSYASVLTVGDRVGG
jgi:hypothetical protein